MADITDEPPPILLPCVICTRTFRPEALERHIKVCEKSQTKKRKIFDSFKCRVSGTDLAEFLGPLPLPGQKLKEKPKEKSSSSWRQTHEALQATLKAARSGNNLPPASTATLGEQCAYCGRSFGRHAYDRHVEFCREKSTRIQQNHTRSTLAQQRLELRTKYKAPLTRGKSPLKEKCSPLPTRKIELSPTIKSTQTTFNEKPKTFNRSGSLRVSNNSNNMKQTPNRSSFRYRSPDKSSLGKPMSAQNSLSKKTEANGEVRPKTAVKKNPLNGETTNSNSDSVMAQNLASIRAAAERQMRLIMSWSPSSPSPQKNSEPSKITSTPKAPMNPLNFNPSPTSAFTSISPSNKENFPDKWEQLFEKEFDEGSSESINPCVLTSTPKAPEKSSRRSLTYSNPNNVSQPQHVSLSSLSLCSDATIADGDLNGIKKSRRRLFARSKSLFEDRNAMLFAQTYDRPESSEDEEDYEDEADVGAPLYSHPEIPLVDRSSTEAINSMEVTKKLKAKLSADSAYSRRDAAQKKVDDRCSSSDTDSQTQKRVDTGQKRVSKFCHECGSKYPIPEAKFCCECGIRRLLVS